MGIQLHTAPAGEPLSIDAVRMHLRIDGTDDGPLINSLIMTARQAAEKELGRALLTQTWDITFDEFSVAGLVLPYPPLQSVSQITYIDAAGVTQTLASSEYQVITDEMVGRVVPAYGKSWPSTRAQHGAVVVRFVAGYGNAVAVPEPIKQWMLLQIGHWYENREAAADRAIIPVPFVAGLLDPHRIVRLM